jgi:sugar phosphate isomerase/epimerase
MTRPVTLFTGQWADLTLEEVAKLASKWGYDGLEIACSGEHLDVWRAAEDDTYVAERLAILDKYNLKLYAISNHLKGQAVCDNPIDFRHKDIVGAKVWGDGVP